MNLTFLNAVRFGGVVYGVPFNKSIQVLYYNKDLLKKHGAKVPATLEEFVAAAKKLSRAEGGPVYWFQPDASTFAYFFFNLGGSYLKDGKLVLNSKEAVEALALLQNGVKEGWAKAITSGYINQNLARGPTPSAWTPPPATPTTAKGPSLTWGWPPCRAGPRASRATASSRGPTWWSSARPPRRSRRWPRTSWSSSSPLGPGGLRHRHRVRPRNRGGPQGPRLPGLRRREPRLRTIVRQSRYAKFEPALAEWEQIRFDILGQAVKEAILNKADPKAALDKAQKLAEDLLSGKTR